MAPKKTIEKRSRATVDSSKERRTKFQEGTSVRVEQPIEDSVPSSRQVISMAMSPVTTGRWIIFSFLKNLGFRLGDLLEIQGW